MSLKTPFNRYRPTKTPKPGGYAESFSSPTTIWGVTRIHQNQTQMIVDIEEDVEINDVIEVGNPHA